MTETATVATLHARYAAEKALDQRDAQRLIALRDKALEEGLSADEQLERIRLEQDRDDRDPRLKRWLREATTAQADLNIDTVVATWDALVAEKLAAYEGVQRALVAFYQAWLPVFAVNHKQEEMQASLPKAGSSVTVVKSNPELAGDIESRLPAGWRGLLTSVEQQTWTQIDWPSVLDVDAGTKPLERIATGRIGDRAQAYRLRMAQQVENVSHGLEEGA
jgi:hypothetical protein